MNKTTTTKTNAFVEARKAAPKWDGIPHRLEYIGSINGVDIINDSKATDAESVMYSLETIKQPVVWVCGNSEELDRFWSLEKIVKYKVVNAYAFGVHTNWKPALNEWVDDFKNHSSLEDALDAALASAKKGWTILFSPGTSSYELYSNFKDRGDAVRAWLAAKQ